MLTELGAQQRGYSPKSKFAKRDKECFVIASCCTAMQIVIRGNAEEVHMAMHPERIQVSFHAKLMICHQVVFGGRGPDQRGISRRRRRTSRYVQPPSHSTGNKAECSSMETMMLSYRASKVYNRPKNKEPHLHPTPQPIVFGRSGGNDLIHEFINCCAALAWMKVPTPSPKHRVVTLR